MSSHAQLLTLCSLPHINILLSVLASDPAILFNTFYLIQFNVTFLQEYLKDPGIFYNTSASTIYSIAYVFVLHLGSFKSMKNS